MKNSNLTWTFITFGVFLLLALYLPSNETEIPEGVHLYEYHYPNTQWEYRAVKDSMWYPSMRPVPPHSWEWMVAVDSPIVEKPER